jgi:hypothetical protein
MKKEIKIAVSIIAVLVVIGLVIFVYMEKSATNIIDGGANKNNAKIEGVPDKMLETQSPDAAKGTQDLINDLVVDNNQEIRTISGTGTESVMGEDGEIVVSKVKPVKIVVGAPGTSAINVDSGKVVNESGIELSNEATVGSQDAPQSSFPMDVKDLPKSAIKLNVTSSGFSPNEFTVNRGQAINLAVTNVNKTTFSEIMRFDDPLLKAVAVGVAKGETISITFNAPDTAGEYTFYSDMFNHRAQGAEGKMIVK